MATVIRNVELDGNPPGVDVRLTLDLTATPVGNGGTIRAEVLLNQDRPARPTRDKFILLKCGGQHQRVQTNDKGFADHEFTVVGFGPHSVRATLEGTGLSVREQHTFTRPPGKIARDLDVRVISGERGKQQLLVTVTAEDHTPVSGSPVIVVGGGGQVQNLATLSDGTIKVDFGADAKYHLRGPLCFVRVQAAGKEWKRTLPGIE